MKFIPILFSNPMVQAILQDCKTMTRRVMKPQPTNDDINFIEDWSDVPMCKYLIGDILWVRETHYAFGEWKKNGTTKTGKQKWKFVRQSSVPVRFIDNKPDAIKSPKFRGLGWYKRSSLFLEKKDCRTFLEITNIKVELLQDISEQDAIAEGIEPNGIHYKHYLGAYYGVNPFVTFKSLWWSINGEDSWEANPYVWVIEFKRIEKPENFK